MGRAGSGLKAWMLAAGLGFGLMVGAMVPLGAEAAVTGPTSGGTSPTESDACVAIALPVMPGMRTCTDRDGQLGIPNDPATGGAIIYYLKYWLILINEAVAGVILLMIIIAAIQYITSAADPGQVKSAKNRLTNAIIALVLYLLMFAILQFLIPGGIL